MGHDDVVPTKQYGCMVLEKIMNVVAPSSVSSLEITGDIRALKIAVLNPLFG
jgi:hypothetical protein